MTEEKYREALYSGLSNITFDGFVRKPFPFEDLFYPLRIDEGKYAFQSYAEQMEFARNSAKQKEGVSGTQGVRGLLLEIRRKIKETTVEAPELETLSSLPEAVEDNENNKFAKQILRRIEKTQNEINVDKSSPEEKALSDNKESDVTYYPEGNFDANEVDHDSTTHILTNTRAETTSIEDNLPIVQRESFLEDESQFSPSSLIIPDKSIFSRILVVASAGHGKSTLLRRVALYYCHPNSIAKEHINISIKYSLVGDYIPCIIKLRDVADKIISVDEAIEKSIALTMESFMPEEMLSSHELCDFIASSRERFLLLIDGLDELSDSKRYEFLCKLEEYLSEYPKTHIIMTSRVAGLSEGRIQDILIKLSFRGRSIIPLTDSDSKEYAEKWIDVTQPEENREQLKHIVRQITERNKFAYLKEFMRTPLELLLILKQIANNSFSLNRYQMFYDTIWEYLTNHVDEISRKQAVFNDTMTFLSFIAYHMQMNKLLFISVKELEGLSDEIRHLSFYTDMIKEGTIQECRAVLDSLASNVGIVERDDRTDDIIYTFPIRAYQEFLTAHACCHLKPDSSLSKPDPYGILSRHLNDSSWFNVLNFALSDLDTNSQPEFDLIINDFFENVNDIEQLRSVVESNLHITIDHAMTMCRNTFTSKHLSDEQRELLLACTSTDSAQAYNYSLRNLYKSDNGDCYLEASCLYEILIDYQLGNSVMNKAIKYLYINSESSVRLGIKIISLVVQILLDEISDKGSFDEEESNVIDSVRNKILSEPIITDELCEALYDNAIKYRSAKYVKALTDLFLSEAENSVNVASYLKPELAEIIISEMNEGAVLIQRLSLSKELSVDNAELREFIELVSTLGAFPFSKEIKSLSDKLEKDIFVSLFIQSLYKKSTYDVKLDQIGMATACLYYCPDWGIDEYFNAWFFEICKGKPSEYVSKDLCYPRERNHFNIMRALLAEEEMLRRDEFYNRNHNEFKKGKSVFSLFREGDLEGAIEHCIKTLDDLSAYDSNKTNLAFLLRYGHFSKINPKTGEEFSIRELLDDGIKSGESYALLNMALYELELGNKSSAETLLSRITSEGWGDVSNKFWYPELWKKSQAPEGALVCVLAQRYAGYYFEDYEEMLYVAEKYYRAEKTDFKSIH